LLGVVVVVGAVSSGDSEGGSSSVDVTTTVPQVVTESTLTPVQKLPLTQTYGRGATGPEIKLIQDRLVELGFDPGTPDGVYGERTQQAVWAFEKLVMGVPSAEVTGKVDAETWSRMQDPIVVLPRRPDSTPNHTEIYLPEQVLVVFHADRAVLITHASSGDNQEWCEEVTIDPGERGNEDGTEPIKEGWCGLSWTPGGVYKYNRMVVGRRESQLGGMYNPVYFNYGIAVHGAQEVPNYPASHGCIRIPMHISDYFQTKVAKGDQVFVFDGVKEPEEYGSPPPRFNWRDPNYTTTTSTTTAAPTTTVPATTVPVTTPPPVTTTTTTTTSTTTTAAPTAPPA
jgi:peptidoglycan hydrolase-like protein with peptidoglycan-binding domain